MAIDRVSIFKEIDKERNYQLAKWGTAVDDTINTPWMWAAYISQYATSWMNGKFAPLVPGDVDRFRESMVKVATLAVAAIESIDRQRADNGAAFFEEAVQEEEEESEGGLDPIAVFFSLLGLDAEDEDQDQDEDKADNDEIKGISVPSEIVDLLDRIYNGKPFTSKELIEAAMYFRDLEDLADAGLLG